MKDNPQVPLTPPFLGAEVPPAPPPSGMSPSQTQLSTWK